MKWKPSSGGGRPKGSRNRFQGKFWDVLEKDFREHGAKTLELMRIERPEAYMKMCAYLMPRDVLLELTNKPLAEFSDEFLDMLESWNARLIEGDATPPMKVIENIKKEEPSE